MSIGVWSYLGEYQAERHEVHAAVERVLGSGQLILGEQVREFEARFAEYCGARHGVGVNSGTDALFLALKLLGVEDGDEVITVSNTAIPTVAAIVSTGAKPVFVDIDPSTYLMNTDLLAERISPRTRCILPVHLFGQCVNMAAVRREADCHGLSVLEDCAQCHGATQHDAPAGSLGDVSAFSFYPTKILGGYGDAGMICTQSEELAKRGRGLRMYGTDGAYYSDEHGYNSRLDELHAAILLGKLAHLDEYVARRQEIAARYDAELADTPLVLPRTAPGNRHAYYLYVCRHPRRDAILEKLSERGIRLNVSYRWPVHTMPAYQHYGPAAGELPETEKAAQEIFSLPMYPSLTDGEQATVCDALHEVLDELA